MANQPMIITTKLKIGISACCMGCPVRYNAKGWDLVKSLGREKSDFIWVPVCPESMAGLGVPRDPIHVAGANGSAIWTDEAKVVSRSGMDVTDAVKAGAISCEEALERAGITAYVYMDGSPTCGVYRTTLKKQKRGNPPGVFGALLLAKGYFLIPASDLQSPLKWWDWRRRLLAFHWIKTVEIEDVKTLYAVWHQLKFICQELDEPWARALGKKLAAIDRATFPEFVETFRKDIMAVLRKPSTPAKITNRLWKHYAHYRKVSGKSIPEINEPSFKRNVTTIAGELIKMERAAIDDGILFGNTPVIYRHRKPTYDS
ncbi:MAG: hypothetical protein PWP38_1925 [Clostridiales bacterium]|nr:hypothetical protein [Clostridiales bacterium]